MKEKIDALKSIAKMMGKLELDRVKGYRKVEKPEEEPEEGPEMPPESDEELLEVLDAKAEKGRPFGKMGRSGSRS